MQLQSLSWAGSTYACNKVCVNLDASVVIVFMYQAEDIESKSWSSSLEKCNSCMMPNKMHWKIFSVSTLPQS